MHWLVITWRLLRYRVALMLIVFMLIGACHQAAASGITWKLLLGAGILACSYVSATALNDLVDEKIDAINHPASPGRPLISKQASRSDLYGVFGLASVITLGLAALLGSRALGLLVASIVINVLYSAPPFKLSHRTFVVPLILAVAYVGVPFMLGTVIVGRALNGSDWILLAGLYCLFVARINLKDFRDRAGDQQYGKPTLLLRYGKATTCWVSGISLLVSALIFFVVLRPPAIWLVAGGFITTIGYLLLRLYQVHSHDEEQLAIGVGAKVGNGLLLFILAAMLLADYGAPPVVTLAVGISLLIAVGYNAFFLLHHPQQAINAYRG